MLRIVAICYNFWTMDSEYCELRTPGGASKVDSFDTRLDLFGFLQVLMPQRCLSRHSSSEPWVLVHGWYMLQPWYKVVYSPGAHSHLSHWIAEMQPVMVNLEDAADSSNCFNILGWK